MTSARTQGKAIKTAGDGLAVYHSGLTAKQGANLTALMARLTEGSRQGYQATWAHYLAWCEGAGRNPANLDAAQALDYLRAHPARRSTQLARLSKLRTIARLLSDVTGDPDLLRARALLDDLRLPLDMHDHQPPEGGQAVDRHAPRRRSGAKALKKPEVYEALRHEWASEALTARNRAILAAGLYGWLRRSEIARLQWSDINFGERAIAIRGAKKRGADHVDTID
ncbi:MAG: site-specific integrase, partial [Anaerolineae bacterium]|nr:site-specific integrase [Anaerolineae bacterium]